MNGDLLTPPPGAEVYNTATANLWIGDDEILRVALREGTVHGAAEVAEIRDAIPAERRRPRPVLVDVRFIAKLTREAREIYADPESNNMTTAVALVIGSPLSRAIGNFFIGLTGTRIPARLFTDPRAALRWLKGQPR